MTGGLLQEDAFRTDRLLLQDWAAFLGDPRKRQRLIEELEALLTPAVLRHLPEAMQRADGPKAIDQWVDARAAESLVMTIRGIAGGDLLGLLILADPPAAGTARPIHLGYLFAEAAWGQGYATETLSGLIELCKRLSGPLRLCAGVDKANPASAKALRKNGFEIDPGSSDSMTDIFCLSL